MKQLIALIHGDLRSIFRDRTLVFFLMGPVFMVLFIRHFIPYLTVKFPVMAGYHHMIMMFAAIQTSIMFGFIVSFITLDEKDQNVLQVIRVLPISTLHFILYRLAFATVFSVLGAFLMITFAGIAYPGATASILLSLQYGLAAPLITLIISTFAQNKVEGMAYFKGVDLVLLLPMLAFLLSGTFRYLFMPVPVYWTYALYDAVLKGQSPWLLFFTGLSIYGIAISILFVVFRKRVFDR